MLFSDRLRLSKEFVEWAEKNEIMPLLSKETKEVIEKVANQVMAFLEIKGLLKDGRDKFSENL